MMGAALNRYLPGRNAMLANEAYVLRLTQINMSIISVSIKSEQIQLAFVAIETECSVDFCGFVV